MTTTDTAAGAPAEAPQLTLEYFDPDVLLIDVNVRTDAEATVDPAFVASIKATKGNLVPVLLLRTADGRLRVDDGARRTIACARAKTQVQGIIVGDEADTQAARRARIIRQVLINDDRLSLPVGDRAQAMLTLFETEGMTETGIAKATGRSKGEVAATLTVARSETARKAAAKWEFLTLEQSAVLSEFEGDTAALTALVKAAKDNPGQFEHVAAQMRASAAERKQRDELAAQLEAEGYEVTDSYIPWHKQLGRLQDADGQPLTEESHAACPGRGAHIGIDEVWPDEAKAAWLAAREPDGDGDGGEDFDPAQWQAGDFDDDEEARAAGVVQRWVVDGHYCADPDGNGHVNPSMASRGGPAAGENEEARAERAAREAAAKTEERRRNLRGNRDWRASTEVRLGHLKRLLALPDLKPRKPKAGKNAPAESALKLAPDLPDQAALLIAQAIARSETQADGVSAGHDAACALLGLDSSGRDRLVAELAAATPARRQVITLAMVLAAAEGRDGSYGACADVHTWQRAIGSAAYYNTDSRPGRYLAWLETYTGYPLSELEAAVAHGEPKTGAQDGACGPNAGDPAGSPGDGEGPGTGQLSAAGGDIAPAPSEIDTGSGVTAGQTGEATDGEGRSCIFAGTPGEDPDDHGTHAHEYDPATQAEPGSEDAGPAFVEAGTFVEAGGELDGDTDWACIMTGADGEDPEDCATHGHQARPEWDSADSAAYAEQEEAAEAAAAGAYAGDDPESANR